MPGSAKPRPPFNPGVPLELVKSGTPEHAWRLIESMKSAWFNVAHTSKQLQERIDEIEAQRLYELWPPNQPYGSLDALIRGALGQSLDEVQSHIIARQASERSQQAAEATTGDVQGRGGDRKSDMSGSIDDSSIDPRAERAKSSGVGLTTQKTLDRLALEFPTLFAEVQAGRISPNRAAIEAGFGSKRVSVYVDDPQKVSAFLAKHFDQDEISAIAEAAIALKEGRD